MITLKNLMVASTHKHAAAMISWLKFDPSAWDTAVYGDDLTGRRYWYVRCIRPIGEITLEHSAWALTMLMPCVAGDVDTLNEQWRGF